MSGMIVMSCHLRRDILPALSANNSICHLAFNIIFSVMRWLNDDLGPKCLLIALNCLSTWLHFVGEGQVKCKRVVKSHAIKHCVTPDVAGLSQLTFAGRFC
jgi:hypothetical protein